MSNQALLAIFGFFFLVMLSIVVGIAMPSKSARAKFKAWAKENLEEAKMRLFFLILVVLLVFQKDED